jgi:hypothetical protein
MHEGSYVDVVTSEKRIADATDLPAPESFRLNVGTIGVSSIAAM